MKTQFVGLIAAVVLSGCAASDGVHEQVGEMPPPVKDLEQVKFRTTDGLTITSYYMSSDSGAAVVLLHQWNADARTWTPYMEEFANKGIATLAVDARGFGESEIQGRVRYAPQWDIRNDIAAAVKFLRETKKIRAVGLAGASYGANNALMFAADHPEIKAVALLSPGEDYHGLKVLEPAMKYKGAALVLTSKGDRGTERGPDQVRQALGNRAEVCVFEGSGHGTAILDDDKARAKDLASFFATHLKE